MPFTAKPDGTAPQPKRLIGWCAAERPTCAEGHVLHGVHTVGGLFVSCQHRDRASPDSDRYPGRCGRHCFVIGVLDHCIVIDLSAEEFNLARRTSKVGDELCRDLRTLIESSIMVVR